ncbi:hypothetical protein PDK45_25135 [Bacillus cereus]|nr:hypothetical protein [Bacillus cereus]
MKTNEYLVGFENLNLFTLMEWKPFYENEKKHYSEKVCTELDSSFGSLKQNSENGVSNFFLENITTFSEVRKYKGKQLVDMDEVEHAATVKNIFDQLENFDVTPIAYEVKKDAVLLCWYVLPVLRAFNDYGILLPDYMDDFRVDDSGRGKE